MKNRIIILLLILTSTLSYSQNNSEIDVFKKIVANEITSNGMYIGCEKYKTYFDIENFTTETALDVPMNILIEIKNNSEKSVEGKWESELISELNDIPYLIKSENCLTKKDIELLFKKTELRQSIIRISEPIFDDNYENCIVSISFSMFIGSARGYTYFLKKVYGKWTIIAFYEEWIT